MDTPIGKATLDIDRDDAPVRSGTVCARCSRFDGTWTCIVVAAIYFLPGLIGHDPWKQDETYITDIVAHMVSTGDWTVPITAGSPFMEKPPLFYWVAAICATLLSHFVPFHDAARVATAVFLGATCGAIAWLGRRWWGRHHGLGTVLVLLSCLGMVLHAHFMLTDHAMLLGFAVAMCGFELCLDRPALAGVILGTGIGIGFLGKGLLAPGVLGMSALMLPVLFSQWRTTRYLRSIVIAAVAASPWLLIWPIALAIRSPDLFLDWLWVNNIGRFVGFSVGVLGAEHNPGFWLVTLPWFTFPALPLAILSLWRNRTTALSRPPFQISLVLAFILSIVLWQSASARNNYALPLLPPLALLAAPAAAALPKWLDIIWRWSAGIFWCVIAAIIWGVWLCATLSDSLRSFPVISNYLPSDFRQDFAIPGFLAALVMTLAPAVLARRTARLAGGGLACWFAGLTTCWALIACLWLSWIDAAKSYRSVFNAVKAVLPQNYHCIAQRGMGESELAMLNYFLGIAAVSVQSPGAAACGVLILEGVAGLPPLDLNIKRWALVWDGARRNDTHERFWLYRTTQVDKHPCD